MLEDGAHVDHLVQAGPPAHLLREQLQQREVLLDLLARVGTLHLHDDAVAAREGGAVDLGDRAGGQRLGVDRLEHVLPRDAQLLLHHLDDLLLGQRRDVVLERGELVDELGRQQVGTRREHLAELRERRAELLERGAQPLGLARASDRAVLVGPAEQLLQAVLGEDRGDVGAARGEARLDGLLVLEAPADRRWARGAPPCAVAFPFAETVFTMITVHRALWLIRFGHVAEEELLAPGHPRVAHHQDVDRARSRRRARSPSPGRRRSPRGRARARRRSPARSGRVSSAAPRGPRALRRPVLGRSRVLAG